MPSSFPRSSPSSKKPPKVDDLLAQGFDDLLRFGGIHDGESSGDRCAPTSATVKQYSKGRHPDGEPRGHPSEADVGRLVVTALDGRPESPLLPRGGVIQQLPGRRDDRRHAGNCRPQQGNDFLSEQGKRGVVNLLLEFSVPLLAGVGVALIAANLNPHGYHEAIHWMPFGMGNL